MYFLTKSKCSYSVISEQPIQPLLTQNKKEYIQKGKMVYGSMPDRVIAEQHSSPFSLHYPKWEVYAARFPASRVALLSNAHDTQPSGRTSSATPGLEWAGHPHAADGPHPEPQFHIFLLPLGLQAAATPPSCLRRFKPGTIFTLYASAATPMGAVWL